ncbi:CTR2 long splice variant [Diplocarpon rosae]|nr:CTR2 long splice variant [Diplocarpon rosae]
MGHSHMDHAAMGHGGMDMGGPARCNMNMLFTWDTTNLCIVFRWWHIRTTSGLLFSLLAVVALTAAYEAIRFASRRYENFVARKTNEVPIVTESTPFLRTGRNQVEVSKRAHVVKALLYAVQTFYAFMLMLLFMTYNGWVMFAMAVGAFVGYLVFGNNTSATKDSACH